MCIRVPVYEYVNAGKELHCYSLQNMQHLFLLLDSQLAIKKTKLNELEWPFYYVWFHSLNFKIT